jgi:hypothetical protein
MKQDGWTRLVGVDDHRFRLERAALLEYARVTLPTRLSRRVVHGGRKDSSAMPAEIWQCGDEVALVWDVRHELDAAGSNPRRVVGFLRQSVGESIHQDDLEPGQQLPQCLGKVEPVQFSAQFWQSDRLPQSAVSDQEVPTKPANADIPSPTEAAQATEKSEEQQRISKAQEMIDEALRKEVPRHTSLTLVDFELTMTATPREGTVWKPQNDRQERHRVAMLLKKAGVCNF